MGRHSIILDCDPGQDDAVAILLALASPDEIELLAITTVAGNVPLSLTQRNARQVVELTKRRDVPIHSGCPRPILKSLRTAEEVHGKTGLNGVTLPDPTSPLAPQHSVDAIVEILMARAPGTVTLCPTGPLTNVALALAQDPLLVRGVDRIVMMAGGFATGGNRTPTAEYNILADPHAARIVFASGAPIVMAALDVTHKAMATPARVAALRARPGRVIAAVAELLAFFDRKNPARYGSDGAPLHDPCAVLYLLAPQLFESRRTHVEICCDEGPAFGQTIADWWSVTGNAPNADVLVGVDADAFFARLGDLLGGYA